LIYKHIIYNYLQRRQSGLKSGGVVDPGKKIRFFHANFTKDFNFSGNFTKRFRFSRQRLAIYSNFWANYFISLQKSPLSNMLPVHDKI